MLSSRSLFRIIVFLFACYFTLASSAQNQNSGPKAISAITFLLSGEKPVVLIPNQGSQPAQTDLLVAENSSGQRTFIVEFSQVAALSNALTIRNQNQPEVVQLSSVDIDNLSSTNIVIQGLSGARLRLTESNTVNSTTTISYEYDLDGVSFDHSMGPNSIIDRFTIVAKNSDGESSTPVDLAILISDVGLAPAPDGSVGMISGIIDAGTGTSIAGILTGTGKNSISISGIASNHLQIYLDGSHKAVASAVLSSDLTNLDLLDGDPDSDFDCVNCLSQGIPTDLSLWVDTVTQTATNYTVHFSRRVNTAVTIDFGAGDEQYNTSNIIGVYSEDLTPNVSATAQGTGTISYSKLLGSNPLDQNGASGTLGTVNISVNYGTQQITAFDMNLTTAEGSWDTGLLGTAPVDLTGASNTIKLSGDLTPTGTSTLLTVYGDVQLGLLGDGAEGILMTFNLSVIDSGAGSFSNEEVIGAAVLESTQ